MEDREKMISYFLRKSDSKKGAPRIQAVATVAIIRPTACHKHHRHKSPYEKYGSTRSR